MLPLVEKKEKSYIPFVFAVLLFITAATLSFQSCDEADDYMVHETAPDYFEPATLILGEYRNSGNMVAYQKYLDSIYYKYRDRSILDKCYVWCLYADSYGRIGEDEKALTYTDSVIELINNNPANNFARDNYLWAYYYKADYALRGRRYDDAYSNYYKALSFAEKYHDSCAIGYYYLRMGIILFQVEQYRDANNYFRYSFDFCGACEETFGYFFRKQQLLNDIGLCYERTKQYDSAIYYYEKGIELIRNGKSNFSDKWQHMAEVATSILKGNLGGVYLADNRLSDAENVLKEALSSEEYKFNEAGDVIYTKLKLANVYIKTGKLTEADVLLKEIKQKVDKQGGRDNIIARLYRARWLYWQKKNNQSKAYEALRAYVATEDSLKAERVGFSLIDVDKNVKNIGNEYKIAALQNEADKRKILLFALIGLAVLSLIIIVQVIINLRKSKKHVEQLKGMNVRIEEQSTKLKDVLAELENADTEKDRILKAVSHDMRSPVNSMLALIDLLFAEGEALNEEQVEYLSLMKKSGENALSLTKDLLEVATIHAERLEKEVVDITAEIDARVRLLQFKATEKQQKLKFNAPDNHISASVNNEKLLRVVGNLVNNAIKFSPIGGDIEVLLTASQDSFTISVKDSGIGIPDNMKDKVFDLFSEAKRFGTSGEQPFGLGLSISKQIVEAHSGKIWFNSKEGEGTTFYVDIPI